MRFLLTRTLPILSAAALCASTPAVAQSAAICPENEQATKAFDSGIRLLEQNLARAALDAFQHSFDLSHCMRALAHVAFAERGLRRWADAAEHLRIALESNDPWIAEKREAFQDELRNIEARLQQAGGRNEDSEPGGSQSRSAGAPRPAAWVLTLGGLGLVGAGIATMSVAQAFASSVAGANFDMWTHGGSVYSTAIPVGGAVLGVGGAALVAGVTLLVLPRREQAARQVSLRATVGSLAIHGSL